MSESWPTLTFDDFSPHGPASSRLASIPAVTANSRKLGGIWLFQWLFRARTVQSGSLRHSQREDERDPYNPPSPKAIKCRRVIFTGFCDQCGSWQSFSITRSPHSRGPDVGPVQVTCHSPRGSSGSPQVSLTFSKQQGGASRAYAPATGALCPSSGGLK